MNTPIHKYILIIFLLFKVVEPVFSQSENDSIQKIIDSKTGEEKCSFLIQLSQKNRIEGSYYTALAYAKEALQLILSDASIKDKERVYFELGFVYQYILEYDKSLNYYLKANEGYESKSNLIGQGAALCNIGEVYRLMRNYKKAIEYITT